MRAAAVQCRTRPSSCTDRHESHHISKANRCTQQATMGSRHVFGHPNGTRCRCEVNFPFATARRPNTCSTTSSPHDVLTRKLAKSGCRTTYR